MYSSPDVRAAAPKLTTVSSLRLLGLHYSVVARHWWRAQNQRRIVVLAALTVAAVFMLTSLSGMSSDYSQLYSDTLSKYQSSKGKTGGNESSFEELNPPFEDVENEDENGPLPKIPIQIEKPKEDDKTDGKGKGGSQGGDKEGEKASGSKDASSKTGSTNSESSGKEDPTNAAKTQGETKNIEELVKSKPEAGKGSKAGANGNSDDEAVMPLVDADTLALKLPFPKLITQGESNPSLDEVSKKWYDNKNFGIVIDAGSSGSRVHVYSWDNPIHKAGVLGDNTQIDQFPIIEKGVEDQAADDDEWQLKSKPGISSYATKPDEVDKHIEPLMKFALNKIPAAKRPSTPVYLMATAGLRLVEENTRNKILKNVCEYVRDNYEFDVSGGCDIHFRVISGELEGIYGWIMVNYLKGGFNKALDVFLDSKAFSKSTRDEVTPNEDNTVKELEAPESKEETTESIEAVEPVDAAEPVAAVEVKKDTEVDLEMKQDFGINADGSDRLAEPPVKEELKLASNVEKAKEIEKIPGSKDLTKQKVDGDTRVETFGFLDMGGASTQIAFEPALSMSKQHNDDLTTVKLRTVRGQELDFNIFVTTFLGFGMNEARRRYLSKLIVTQLENPNGLKPRAVIPLKDSKKTSNLADLLVEEGAPKTVTDPCMPLGLEYKDESHLPKELTSFSDNLVASGKEAISVTFVGSGDLKKCIDLQQSLLNKELPCKDTPCLFNGVHAPISQYELHKFLGVSEYWYSSDEVLGLGGVYDYGIFLKASEELCNRPWTEIEDLHRAGKYPSVKDLSTIKLQCFKAGWIINVLHDGLGIPKDLPKLPIDKTTNRPVDDLGSEELKQEDAIFESVNEIKEFGLSWTLGTIIMHVAATIPKFKT